MSFCPSSPTGKFQRTRKLTPDQRDIIAKRYASGERSGPLSQEFGVNKSLVSWIAKERGIPTNRTSRKKSLNEAAFSTVTPESAYWAGLMMADGCVSDRGYFHLALAETDKAHVEAFRSFLGSDHKITVFKKATGQACHALNVLSQHISADLATFGIVPRKSATACVLRLAENRHFWRGMVDGDGTMNAYRQGSNRYPRISLCGSRACITQFCEFIHGAFPYLSPTPNRHTRDLFWASVAGRHAILVISLLYQDARVALPRKAKTAARLIAEFDAGQPDRRRSRP